MRETDRKCPPPVKIRLAPLPTKLSFANSSNLEECLNRSVAMDRPSSRISDISNFSASSMISAARSNYENHSDERLKSMNHNLIEALRMKDMRRKRNHLNENADNYSVDLGFQSAKRKRAYDEESELDSLLDGQHSGENLHKLSQSVKFAKVDNRLSIPSRNRLVSSKFKNNEIASSYYSLNNPMASSSSVQSLSQSLNQPMRSFHQNQLNASTGHRFVSSNLQRATLFPSISDNAASLRPLPHIMISNNSKENSSNLSNTLSNASISPIGKKTSPNVESSSNAENISSSSNVLKSSTSSSFQSTENMSVSCNEVENNAMIVSKSDLTSSRLSNKSVDNRSMTQINEKNHSPTYKIPEHFHSIDEHIRDEKKARSRLGNFLRAIYNVTSPFLAKTTEPQNEVHNSNSLTANTDLSAISSVQVDKSINKSTATNLSIMKPASDKFASITSNTNSNKAGSSDSAGNSSTLFKLPLTNENVKPNPASKVTFDLPLAPNKESSTTQTSSSNSSAFKFGQDSSSSQINNLSTSNKADTSSGSLFKFGCNQQTPVDRNTGKSADKLPQFNLPASSAGSLSSALSSMNASSKTSAPTLDFSSTFSAQNKESSKTDSSANTSSTSKNLFSMNQIAPISNFNSNPANSSSTSSLFSFGQTNTNNSLSVDKPESNKSSSYVFNFGSSNASANASSTLNSTTIAKSSQQVPVAPVFNFGQAASSQMTSNDSIKVAPNDSTSLASNSLFSFGQSINDKQSIVKPAVTNAFSFNNSTLVDASSNSSIFANNSSLATQNSTFKAPTSSAFQFGASSNTLQQLSKNPLVNVKPAANFSFGTSASKELNKPKQDNLNLSSTLNNNSNVQSNAGFNFGLNANLNPTTNASSTSAFDFGASSSNANAGLAINFTPQQPSNTSTPFKFDASQTKPSFNFGSSSTQPSSGYNFSAAQSVPQFGLNNASNNMFTIGRK